MDSLTAILDRLKAAGETLAVAESLTGGGICSRIVDIPGASGVLIEGVVAYANESKIRRLAVPEEVLAEHGAVSAEVAAAMATGVRAGSGGTIGLAVTGIAGPSGGTPDKPVGLVYLALDRRGEVTVQERRYAGDRAAVRAAATDDALRLLAGAAD